MRRKGWRREEQKGHSKAEKAAYSRHRGGESMVFLKTAEHSSGLHLKCVEKVHGDVFSQLHTPGGAPWCCPPISLLPDTESPL